MNGCCVLGSLVCGGAQAVSKIDRIPASGSVCCKERVVSNGKMKMYKNKWVRW